MKTQQINPTVFRFMNQEPIDITHEIVGEAEWERNWSNYHPVAIVSPPGLDSNFDLGFREACTQVLRLANDYLVEGTPAHARFCKTVRDMYDGRL